MCSLAVPLFAFGPVGAVGVRLVAVFPVLLRGDFGQPGHRYHALSIADAENYHAGAATPDDADLIDGGADHHAAIGNQHDLVLGPDREDRDHRVAAAGQIHVVDALPAAPGDPIAIGRAAHPKTLFGDAQQEFLARCQIGEQLLGNRRHLDIDIVSFGRLLVLAVLPPPLVGELDVGVADFGRDRLVAQDRHRDNLVVAQEPYAAHADRGPAGKDPD